MPGVSPGPGQETWILLPGPADHLRWGARATDQQVFVWLLPWSVESADPDPRGRVEALIQGVTKALGTTEGLPVLVLFRARIGEVHAVRLSHDRKRGLSEWEGAIVAGGPKHARHALVQALGFAGSCWPEWGALLDEGVLEHLGKQGEEADAGAAEVPSPTGVWPFPTGEA